MENKHILKMPRRWSFLVFVHAVENSTDLFGKNKKKRKTNFSTLILTNMVFEVRLVILRLRLQKTTFTPSFLLFFSLFPHHPTTLLPPTPPSKNN